MTLVPPGVVTVISTVPAVPDDGEVTVIWVAPPLTKLVAEAAPKCTAETPRRLVPVIVTLLPPFIIPEFGEIAVTFGAPIVVVVAISVF